VFAAPDLDLTRLSASLQRMMVSRRTPPVFIGWADRRRG
jgi:hypothetical protein